MTPLVKQLHLKQLRSDRLQLLLKPEFQSAGHSDSADAAERTVGDTNCVNKDLAGNSPKPDNIKLVVANDTVLPDSDEETWVLPGASP